MNERCLSLWLPEFPIERMRRAARRRGEPPPAAGRPFALVAEEGGRQRITAIEAVARRRGIRPGMALADARAVLPELRTRPAEPARDAAALEALAHWCRRYSPRVAVDAPAGILLEITGCSHLFGGETRLLEDLRDRLERFGYTVSAAIADGALAARAWARFGGGGILSGPGARGRLEELPIAALRLAPELRTRLRRLGFRRVGELARLPRASLRLRFGESVTARLEAMLGEGEDPFVPLPEPQRFLARLSFAEPVIRRAAVEAALDRLLGDLRRRLERAERGARELRLRLLRLDGAVREILLATGRPLRDPDDLAPLFRLRLDRERLDPGFGFELMLLEATVTEPLVARQASLAQTAAEESAFARLMEVLSQRLGRGRVLRPEPVESHLPERAVRPIPGGAPPAAGRWLVTARRPLRLLARPLPIGAVAAVPDGPPRLIEIEGRACRIRHAEGPERILPEWWRVEETAARLRDYYRIVTEAGAALWVFREGAYGEPSSPRWKLHGRFD